MELGIDHSNLKLEPIKDLKVGEKLVAIDTAYHFPRKGDCIRVHSLESRIVYTESGVVSRRDFTAIIQNDVGDKIEVLLNSSRFKRLSDITKKD